MITGIGAGVFYSNVYKPSTGRRSWPCYAVVFFAAVMAIYVAGPAAGGR